MRILKKLVKEIEKAARYSKIEKAARYSKECYEVEQQVARIEAEQRLEQVIKVVNDSTLTVRTPEHTLRLKGSTAVGRGLVRTCDYCGGLRHRGAPCPGCHAPTPGRLEKGQCVDCSRDIWQRPRLPTRCKECDTILAERINRAMAVACQVPYHMIIGEAAPLEDKANPCAACGRDIRYLDAIEYRGEFYCQNDSAVRCHEIWAADHQ